MNLTRSLVSISALLISTYTGIADNFAASSPFQISIETDESAAYKAFFYGDWTDSISLIPGARRDEHFYLGVDTTDQFAGRVSGLVEGSYRFLRGSRDESFILYGGRQIYLGEMIGLEPRFIKGTSYSLEESYEEIAIIGLGFAEEGTDDGLIVAQYRENEQPFTLFSWDVERDRAKIAKEFTIPSITFDHTGSQFGQFINPLFARHNSGFLFLNYLAGDERGYPRSFRASFTRDLDLRHAVLIETDEDSDISWFPQGSVGTADSGKFLAFGTRPLNNGTGRSDNGYLSLLDPSGAVLWTKHYTDNSEFGFQNLILVGEWNGHLYIRAYAPSNRNCYSLVIDVQTGNVLHSYEMALTEDIELSIVGPTEDYNGLVFQAANRDNILYGSTDSDFSNGVLVRLGIDLPDDADFSGFYQRENPDLSEVSIYSYDLTQGTKNFWFGQEDHCNLFEYSTFELNEVSIASRTVVSPVVTPVVVNISSPTVNLVDQPLELPTVIEEPSSRAYGCFSASLGDLKPSPWYSEFADLADGWHYSDWLGYFNVSNDPWIYHLEHGWLYAIAEDTENIYFWETQMESILWTSQNVYPSIFRFSDSAWIFYDKGSVDPRWFVDLVSGIWEQW